MFLFLGDLIVCIESSIYCQGFVKQKWHCHIVYCLLAVCLTILMLSIAMIKVMSMYFQMRLNLRGVPSRLNGVLHYYLFLSCEELCCSLVRSYVWSHRGVTNISSNDGKTVVENIFRTVRLLAWLPLQYLPWIVPQLCLLALCALFQTVLCCCGGPWLSGCVRGGDWCWRGWILAFGGFNTEDKGFGNGSISEWSAREQLMVEHPTKAWEAIDFCGWVWLVLWASESVIFVIQCECYRFVGGLVFFLIIFEGWVHWFCLELLGAGFFLSSIVLTSNPILFKAVLHLYEKPHTIKSASCWSQSSLG